MANYTIELRTIIDNGIPIFDFHYPFYDESKRTEFENKFIKHFYFREIGCETVDRFKWYLQDKMNVVFPFYNELMKTALINYDKLNNYDLSETYTRNTENTNKQSGISSTVERAIGEQETETKQNKTVDTSGSFDSSSTDTENETGTSKTDTTGTSTNETTGSSNTTNSDSVSGNSTKQLSGTESSELDTVKKFLDTPQGLTNLSDSKYLTTLNQDTADTVQSKEGTETINDSKTTNGSSENESLSSSNTESTDSSESQTERNASKTSTVEQGSTGTETTADNVTGTIKDERKTTQDNNNRLFSQGEQSESYTLTRKGNIGVQTGSDMIEKHIELQKKLQKIEKMFFEECEDLFMLVW